MLLLPFPAISIENEKSTAPAVLVVCFVDAISPQGAAVWSIIDQFCTLQTVPIGKEHRSSIAGFTKCNVGLIVSHIAE